MANSIVTLFLLLSVLSVAASNSVAPTARPTHAPTAKTARPTITAKPSSNPTEIPSAKPSTKPSARPTHTPTNIPATWTYESGPGFTFVCGQEYDPCSPGNWGQVSAMCSSSFGGQQSPINIASTAVTPSPYMWGPVADSANGGCSTWEQSVTDGTIVVDFDAKNCANLYSWINGDKYVLRQITIHSASEHSVGGGRYPGEVQLTHVREGDMPLTAIVSIFLQQSSVAGTDNPFLASILGNFVQDNVFDVSITGAAAINPYTTFTPAKGAQYYYSGSTTTPPCYTNVDWYIYEQPVFVSTEQLAAVRTWSSRPNSYGNFNITDSNGNNFRPTQPLMPTTDVYYIPGGQPDSPSPTNAPVFPTMAPSQLHHMPRNALIVGGVAIALAGVLLIVAIALFFVYSFQATAAASQSQSVEMGQI